MPMSMNVTSPSDTDTSDIKGAGQSGTSERRIKASFEKVEHDNRSDFGPYSWNHPRLHESNETLYECKDLYTRIHNSLHSSGPTPNFTSTMRQIH